MNDFPIFMHHLNWLEAFEGEKAGTGMATSGRDCFWP